MGEKEQLDECIKAASLMSTKLDEADAEIERLTTENERLREAVKGSEQSRLMGEQKLAATQAEVERLRTALQQCYAEANEAVQQDADDETLSFGNHIHIKRICDAALTQEGRDG